MNIKKWEVAPLNKERAAQIAERYSLPFFLSPYTLRIPSCFLLL